MLLTGRFVFLLLKMQIMTLTCLLLAIITVDSSTILNSILNQSPSILDNQISSTRSDSEIRRHFLDLKHEDIPGYLRQHGGAAHAIQEGSLDFMVRLFERLMKGETFQNAVRHMDRQMDGQSDSHRLTEVEHSDTIRCLPASENIRKRRLSYTIPELASHEQIKLAELRFAFKNGSHSNARTRVSVLIRYNRTSSILVKLKLKQGKLRILDITDKLLSFVRRFTSNVSVEIRYRVKTNKRDPFTADFQQNSELPVPMLLLYSQDKSFLQDVYQTLSSVENKQSDIHAVAKREVDETDRQKRRRRRKKWRKNEKCQLHDFKVDFDLLGWGRWIIHPKTFNAKVCYGQCPSPITKDYTPTNHALLQTLMKMKRPLVAPEPCCVPTKFRPLSMLYFEDDTVVVRYHENMVATECGCR